MASGGNNEVHYEPRGVEVGQIIRMWHWSKGIFAPSTELRPSSCPIDYFISHSWAASSFSKYSAIFLLFAGKVPFVASAWVAVVVAIMDLPIWIRVLSTLSAFASGLTFECLKPRSKHTVFFDIACIPQTPFYIKHALASLERCIEGSRGLIVLWTDDCRRSKWCIFELATFLHHNPDKPLEIWCLNSLENSLILYIISVNYFIIRFSTDGGGHLLFDVAYCIIVNYFIAKVDLPSRLRFLRDSRNIQWCPRKETGSEYPMDIDEVINQYFGSWQEFSTEIERRKPDLSDQWAGGLGCALRVGLLMAFPAILVCIVTHYSVASSVVFLLPPFLRAILFYTLHSSYRSKLARGFYEATCLCLVLVHIFLLQAVWPLEFTHMFGHSMKWTSVVCLSNVLLYSLSIIAIIYVSPPLPIRVARRMVKAIT